MSDQNAGKVPPPSVPQGSQRPPPLPSAPSTASARVESIDDLLDDFIVQANRSHASASSANWDLRGEPELIDAAEVEEELVVQEAAAEDEGATLAMTPSAVAQAVSQPAPTVEMADADAAALKTGADGAQPVAGPPQAAPAAALPEAGAAPMAEPVPASEPAGDPVVDSRGASRFAIDVVVETAAEAAEAESADAEPAEAVNVAATNGSDTEDRQGQGTSKRERRRERAPTQRPRRDSGEIPEGALAAEVESLPAAAADVHVEHAAPAPKKKAVADHAAPSPKTAQKKPEQVQVAAKESPVAEARGAAVRPLPLPQTTQRSGIGIGTLVGAMLAAAVLTAGVVYFATQWTGGQSPQTQAAAPTTTAPAAQPAPAAATPAPAAPTPSVAAAPTPSVAPTPATPAAPTPNHVDTARPERSATASKDTIGASGPLPQAPGERRVLDAAPLRPRESPVASAEADKSAARHPVKPAHTEKEKTRPASETAGLPPAEAKKPDSLNKPQNQKPAQKPAKPADKKKEEWIDPFAQ